MNDMLQMEIKLNLSPLVSKSEREVTQILDFLGDTGGFYQALDLMVFMFAEYFAAKLFLISLANKFYRLRKSKENVSAKDPDIVHNLSAQFEKP